MRIKWWIKLLLNAGVNFGLSFFSFLGGLNLTGYGFDWKTALVGAFIMGGISFFATCKHYFEEDEDDKDGKEKDKPKKFSAHKAHEKERHSDIVESRSDGQPTKPKTSSFSVLCFV